MERNHSAPLRMTETQFLDWAGLQDRHYELVDGVVMMQAGATRDHERGAKRVFAALLRQVDEARWDVNKGDFGVGIRAGRAAGSVLHPDVVVDRQSQAGHERAPTTPAVIVEVLSPSTDLAHHIEKIVRYRILDTLLTYAVFNQKSPIVHVWTRRNEGWPDDATRVEGYDGRVPLPEIGAMLDFAEIYRPVAS